MVRLIKARRSFTFVEYLLLFQLTALTTLFPFNGSRRNANVALVEAFRYKLNAQELIAPEMLCFSGDAPSKKGFASNGNDSSLSSWSVSSGGASKTQFSCPTTPDDVESYPAVVMDTEGYVKVHIRDIRLRDDGRRRNGFHQSHEDGSMYKTDQEGKRLLDDGAIEKEDKQQLEKIDSDLTESEVVKKIQSYPHHMQVYLVSLDNYSPAVLRSQCCYELETSPPDWIEKTPEGKVILPEECKYNPSNNKKKSDNESGSNSIISAFSHDYRVNAARIRPLGHTSAPIHLNVADNTPGIDLITTLRPTDLGRYMVVVSNCAAELSFDSATNTTSAKGLKMVMSGVDINFVSKFGELPLSMMGIIPFYGLMTSLYLLLSLVWVRQSNRGGSKWWKRGLKGRNKNSHNQYSPVTLLGLQSAIRTLVFCETGFSALAFSYYLYLNGTSVDVNVLYSGTAAALVNWGPWSIAVALAHFGTLLACQIVVTLATDGMWLIQSNINTSTKKVLYLMVFIWALYFVAYGFLSEAERRTLYMCFGLAWILFLLFNVRRSLQHLRTLMIGQSTDQIIAVGGAIVAKRSMYRKMCVIVGVYPIIFAASFVWTSVSNTTVFKQWTSSFLIL